LRQVAKPPALLAALALAAALLPRAFAEDTPPAPRTPVPDFGDPAAAPSAAEVERLVELLGSDSWAERERATERLAAIGKAAHEALRRALASPDAEVRYRARLVLRAPLRKVALLLQEVGRRQGALGDESAFRALVAIGEEALDPLAMLLRRDLAEYQGGDEERLRVALQAIQEIGAKPGPGREERSARAREALLSLLDLHLHNFDAQLAASLRALGDDEARAALGARLTGGAVLARRNGVHVLGLLGGEAAVKAIASALADAEATVRKTAIDALVEAARADGKAAPLREAAAEAIVGRLGDDDRQVETRAIEALGELRAKAAIAPLRKIVAGAGVESALDDERVGAAIGTLGRLDDRESIPMLIPFLKAERPDLVAHAADALGLLRARDAVPALLDVLSREEPAPIVRALRALGRIADERAFEPLKAFYVQKALYRQRTLVAIARIDGPRPLDFLIERAKASEDEFEVRLALEAVSRRASGPEGRAQLGEAALAALARQPVDLRTYAMRLLARARYAPAYEAVARLLTSSDSRLAAQAVETVAALGDKRAIDTLRGLLKSPDEDIQRSSVVALAKLGEPEPLRKAIAETEAAVKRAPEDARERFQLGLYYLYAKDNAKGAAEFEALLAQSPRHNVAAYNLACARSLLGEKDAAIDALRKSIELGFRDWRHMEQDDDLDNIRDTQEMRAIMERLRREETGSDLPRLALSIPGELDEPGPDDAPPEDDR
jgi:HEAT repeat protein